MLSIANFTKQVYTIIPTSYTTVSGTKGSSAEWIVEAPSSSSGVLPLADFNVAMFNNCQATINGKTGTISNSKWKNDAISMVTSKGTVKATPSSLKNKSQEFNVTWQHQ